MIAEPVEQIETVELTRRRFTAAEYMRLAETGILAEDDKLELLWGEIVEMSPINMLHALCVNRLTMLLSAKLTGRAIVSVQNPLQIDEYSIPQPDIALWKLPYEEYADRLPGPSDVLLVIEVADSSIQYDRNTKAKLYGAAGIADYWIINLPARQIEVYREPRPSGGYRTMTIYAPGETLSLLAFADVNLGVDDIIT